MASRKRLPMRVSATQFRANLFEYLRRVENGERVTMEYKGAAYQILPIHRSSKLERLAKLPSLDVINGTWEEFVDSSKKLSLEMQEKWEEKWNRRLRE